MKFASFLTFFALATATNLVAAADSPKAGAYQIDTMHSKVGFEVPHLVISSVEGVFRKFDGTVNIAKDFQRSTVTARVDVASVDTGVKQRDDHLRSADFFDAKKFPTMSFESTKVRGTPKSFSLDGKLSIKGVSKNVTFKGKVLGETVDGYGNHRVAVKAQTEVDRKDFGLTYNSVVESGPVVGDDVTITLNLQGIRK